MTNDNENAGRDRYGLPEQPDAQNPGAGRYGGDPTAQYPAFDANPGYGQEQSPGFDQSHGYAPGQQSYGELGYGPQGSQGYGELGYGYTAPGTEFQQAGGDGGSKAGAIIGVAVAALVVIGLVVGLVVWSPWKKDEESNAGATSAQSSDPGGRGDTTRSGSSTSRGTSSRSASSSARTSSGGAVDGVTRNGYIDATLLPAGATSAAGLGPVTNVPVAEVTSDSEVVWTSRSTWNGQPIFFWTYKSLPESYSAGTDVSFPSSVQNGGFWKKQYVPDDSTGKLCNITYFSTRAGYLEIWRRGDSEDTACRGLTDIARALSPSLPF